MNRHPDSDHMALQVVEHNASTLYAADLLCWALAVVLLATMGVMWWPL